MTRAPGGPIRGRIHRLAIVALGLAATAACSHPPQPLPRRYQLEGQILAINPSRQELTIKHGDIPGFMDAMTMSYGVARPDLLRGRTVGELIKATLEVTDEDGKLVEITHVGEAPLPSNTNTAALAAGVLDIGDKVPDVAIVDTHNERRSTSDWHGTPTVVTFIYTRCPLPDFCPRMDQNFKRIQTMAAADPVLKGRIRLASITFDPEFDTPAVLKKHAAQLGADEHVWMFYTGDRAATDKLAAEFGVSTLRDPSSPAMITHTLRTTLVGADGTVKKVYRDNDWAPAQVIADLRAELGSR